MKALLPLRQGESAIPVDTDGVGGVRLGGLDRRMRDRWRIISNFWDDNKAAANELNLLGRVDYHRELSSQFGWQQDQGQRPVRVVYASAGQPTAAILIDETTIVDYKLFWVPCKDLWEANYLLAIINSNALYSAVTPLMSKGQFGARDVQKHLWKLPIPEFDAANPLHLGYIRGRGSGGDRSGKATGAVAAGPAQADRHHRPPGAAQVAAGVRGRQGGGGRGGEAAGGGVGSGEERLRMPVHQIEVMHEWGPSRPDRSFDGDLRIRVCEYCGAVSRTLHLSTAGRNKDAPDAQLEIGQIAKAVSKFKVVLDNLDKMEKEMLAGTGFNSLENFANLIKKQHPDVSKEAMTIGLALESHWPQEK